MKTTLNRKCDKGEKKHKTIQKKMKERIVLMENTNWAELYALKTSSNEFEHVAKLMNNLINAFCPTNIVTTHSTDKPWVTHGYK